MTKQQNVSQAIEAIACVDDVKIRRKLLKTLKVYDEPNLVFTREELQEMSRKYSVLRYTELEQASTKFIETYKHGTFHKDGLLKALQAAFTEIFSTRGAVIIMQEEHIKLLEKKDEEAELPPLVL